MVFSTPSILSLVGVAFWLWIKNRRPDATTLPALQVGLLLVIYSDFRDSACGTVSPNGRRDTVCAFRAFLPHHSQWSSGQMVYLHGLDGTTILFLNNVKLVLKPKQPHSLLFRNDIQQTNRPPSLVQQSLADELKTMKISPADKNTRKARWRTLDARFGQDLKNGCASARLGCGGIIHGLMDAYKAGQLF
ncbi:hypothetical protein PTI98_010261 [Pleurotus ostreatus]|nr:hypothetical protein PTI98_010261 [Pleurotus ostreatus]